MNLMLFLKFLRRSKVNKNFLKLILCVVFASHLIACSEDTEQKKLGEAQACLDRIPQNNPISAQTCMSYISGLDSKKADAIRCSIGFLAGGITTTRLVQAVKQIDEGQDAEATFVSLLLFNGINPNDTSATATHTQAMTNVTTTVNYCNRSEVKGLMYLGNFAVVGTALIAAVLTGSNDAFWRDPQPTDIQSEVDGAVTACTTTPENCNPETVGAAIIALGDSYCKSGDAANDSQCLKVKEAIAAGGGDPAAIGAEFFRQLQAGGN